jgi:hypothetical protein
MLVLAVAVIWRLKTCSATSIKPRMPHDAAPRHFANRLVGILLGCLSSRTTCDETIAWAHHAVAA